jgi:hypothetical protein
MKDQVAIKEHELRWMLELIKTWSIDQLLTGLVALTKDMAEYLASRGFDGPGAERFWRAYSEAMNEDRMFWEQLEEEKKIFKTYAELFPGLHGYAATAAMTFDPEELRIEDLKNPDFTQSWILVKGMSFLKKDLQRLSNNISGIKNTYEQSTNKPFEERVLEIYNQLRKEGFSDAYWVPLLLFVSYLFSWSCFYGVETTTT